MTSELEKIDLIRARIGVGYKEAKEALDKAGGDVLQALIALEEKNRNWSEKVSHRGNEIVGQVKSFLRKGQDTKIKIKKGDRTVFEVPASVGALGVVGALASTELAVLGVIGTLTAMANKYTLEFDKSDEQEEEQADIPRCQ